MIHTPNELIDPLEQAAAADALLSDVLNRVRLSGAIFLRAEYTSPWAYESPPPGDMIHVLRTDARWLILFHIIAEGGCWIRTARGDHIELQAGEVVVLPYGEQHVMGSSDPSEPIDITTLMPPPPWDRMLVLRYGGGGGVTSVVCGYLLCSDPMFDPIARALPSLFKVRPTGPAAAWVDASIRYALDGANGVPAANGANVRLPELLFLEVLRLYVQNNARQLGGWLSAMHDPLVGRAMRALHADPARRWTADDLAAAVACSRSTLNERFGRQVGRPPMQYLAEWRLQLAAGLLRESSLGVAAVAHQIGYESEEAFNRAFKRAMGAPPAHWRASQRPG